MADDFRIPAETRMGAVTLRVASLERSLAFYRDLMDLAVVARADERVTLAAVADGPPLIVLEEHPHIRPRPEGQIGLYHYAILFPDREALGRTLLRLFEVRWPFQGFADHAVSEAGYLADPDGNGIELAADRPASEWQWRNGELHMTTLALNVSALRRAVDGEPWTGLPADARVGHSLLHVSRVAGAEAFYANDLGFDVVTRAYPGAIFLSAGGYHHHLGVNTWAHAAPVPPETIAGLIDFGIDLPAPTDARALAERMRGRGHAVEDRGNDTWRVTDGDGNAVVIGVL
jgi:catechol 2,3-dioxygenase